MTDDRRYESYEMRAAYDDRYVVDSRHITSKAAVKAAHAEADRIYIEMGKAREAGKAAGRGTPAYDAAVSTFAFYAEQRRDIFRRIAEFEARS